MLTIAYWRVSTEEQAEEGFSIEGQADKLRAYSTLRDLGDVTVLTDPGRSGKDMLRPGLQQLLAEVEAGHVRHVLVWRLDRLSRNLGNLMWVRTSRTSPRSTDAGSVVAETHGARINRLNISYANPSERATLIQRALAIRP